MAKPTSQSSSEKSGGSHESQSHAKMPPSRDNVFKSRRLEENARKDLISGEAKIGNDVHSVRFVHVVFMKLKKMKVKIRP